jgi:predicted outer membrane protein
MFIRLIAAIAATFVCASGAFAQNTGKPTDPQIAHPSRR